LIQLNFQANQYKPQYGNSGGGLPVGTHKVVIEKTEMVPVKDNPQNHYLAITLKCVEGPAQGQTQVDRLNIHNLDPNTVYRANQQLSAYCHVVGKANGFGNTSELFGIPFMVEIVAQKNNADFTQVKKVMDINGNEPGQGGNAGQQAAPSQGAPAGFQAVGGGFQAPQQQNGAPQTAPQGGSAPGGWAPPAGGAPQQQPAPGAYAVDPAPAQGGPAPWSQPGGAPQQQAGGWQQPQQQQQAAPQQGGWQPGAQPGGAAPGWGPR
jgi:hypothetical protein